MKKKVNSDIKLDPEKVLEFQSFLKKLLTENNIPKKFSNYFSNIFELIEKLDSEKREIKTDLENSKRILEKIWEKSIDGMRLTTSNGIVYMCNNAYADLVCKSRAEIEGEQLSSVYEEINREHVQSSYIINFRDSNIKTQYTSSAKLWNGKTINIRMINSFIDNINGEKMVLIHIQR